MADYEEEGAPKGRVRACEKLRHALHVDVAGQGGLFSDLGITASHSRPRVSNDNPFSEAQFRTVKYRPEFPARFGALEHARGVNRDACATYRCSVRRRD